MTSFNTQLLTFGVMLIAFEAFADDKVLMNNTLIATMPERPLQVISGPDRSTDGKLHPRVYAKDFGRFTSNIDVVQLLTSTGKTYLGASYPFYIDRPEGVIGVGMNGSNIQCDLGFLIPDDLLKKGSQAIWDAFEAGSLSKKDVTDLRLFGLPFHMLGVFGLADRISNSQYSIRSITLRENRVTVEVLNTKKTHVGLVTFDASKWPWSITDAWIDDKKIDLIEEKQSILKLIDSAKGK